LRDHAGHERHASGPGAGHRALLISATDSVQAFAIFAGSQRAAASVNAAKGAAADRAAFAGVGVAA